MKDNYYNKDLKPRYTVADFRHNANDAIPRLCKKKLLFYAKVVVKDNYYNKDLKPRYTVAGYRHNANDAIPRLCKKKLLIYAKVVVKDNYYNKDLKPRYTVADYRHNAATSMYGRIPTFPLQLTANLGAVNRITHGW